MRDQYRRKDATEMLPHLALTHRERVFLAELIERHGADLKAIRPDDSDESVGYKGIDAAALRRILMTQVIDCSA
jgi:hypothetical protein